MNIHIYIHTHTLFLLPPHQILTRASSKPKKTEKKEKKFRDKNAEDDQIRDHYQQPMTVCKTKMKKIKNKKNKTRTPKTTRPAITISSQ